jgi:dTDP-4-amino-4,6-dideoxygalactose transaminase
MTVPFNRPHISPRTRDYLSAVVDASTHCGDGTQTKACQQMIKDALGVPAVLLTPSCTAALEMAAILAEVGPGDEVIVPTFTFVSTANAFALRGAQIKFADIDSRTMNLDMGSVEKLLSPNTKVVVPVHYAGVGCDMDRLAGLQADNRFMVVEDNAHGFFGRLGGRYLGTFGALATVSFHETKNFSCGEGGALIINDEVLVGRAEVIREKGTNRSRFFRGMVDKYTWMDLGSSYLPSEFQAAVLRAQLEEAESIQRARRMVWQRYDEALRSWAESHGIQTPWVPEVAEPAWHMYYLLLRNLEQRQSLMNHLRERGMLAVFHYLPLHLSDYGRSIGGSAAECPVAEQVSDCLLRLPFYTGLDVVVQQRVIETVLDWRPVG